MKTFVTPNVSPNCSFSWRHVETRLQSATTLVTPIVQLPRPPRQRSLASRPPSGTVRNYGVTDTSSRPPAETDRLFLYSATAGDLSVSASFQCCYKPANDLQNAKTSKMSCIFIFICQEDSTHVRKYAKANIPVDPRIQAHKHQ